MARPVSSLRYPHPTMSHGSGGLYRTGKNHVVQVESERSLLETSFLPCCNFVHGLKKGHGDQCAARAPYEEMDPRGIGGSGGPERPLSRVDSTSDSFSKRHGTGKACPGISDRSMRVNPRSPSTVRLTRMTRGRKGWHCHCPALIYARGCHCQCRRNPGLILRPSGG